jgi:hypothetical protein
VDTAGNAFLNHPPLFEFMTGNRPDTPATTTLYVKDTTNRPLLDHRLRRDTHGTLTLLKHFWNLPVGKMNDLVAPLLIYADLLAIGDSRTVEVAGGIHDQCPTHEAD